VPPEAFTVAAPSLPPLQDTDVVLDVKVMGGGEVIVTVAVSMHPLRLVAVTT
jgi:hypothetical protein